MGGDIEPDMQIGKVGESVVKGGSGGRSSSRKNSGGEERNIGTRTRVGLTSDVLKGSMGALPLPLPIIVTLGVIAIVKVTMKTLGLLQPYFVVVSVASISNEHYQTGIFLKVH